MTAQQPTLWGIDFTSAPSPQKPIVAVEGKVHHQSIEVVACHRWYSLADFVEWLYHPGYQPWYAGLDIPLGFPEDFLCEVGWLRDTWEATYTTIGALPKADYIHTIRQYQLAKPSGQKEPRRACDIQASAKSPTKVYQVPLAKMLYEGGTRLAKANHIHIWPGRLLANAPCHAVEVYPALVIRYLLAQSDWLQHQSYKTGEVGDTQQADVRQWLLASLQNPQRTGRYDYHLVISDNLDDHIIQDSHGDIVDALACLLQVGWVYKYYQRLGGLFPNAKPLEGWIVDPHLVEL